MCHWIILIFIPSWFIVSSIVFIPLCFHISSKSIFSSITTWYYRNKCINSSFWNTHDYSCTLHLRPLQFPSPLRPISFFTAPLPPFFPILPTLVQVFHPLLSPMINHMINGIISCTPSSKDQCRILMTARRLFSK